jgi:hypothetical protein
MGDEKQRTDAGLLPGQWEDLFRKADVQVEALDAAKSRQARATLLGNFLVRNLDREVPIEVKGRQGKARLRAVAVGRRQKRYFFEVRWEADGPADPATRPGPNDQSGAPNQRPPDEPVGRRPGPQEPTRELVDAAASSPPPDRNGGGNQEDWS